jgi:TolB-like protein
MSINGQDRPDWIDKTPFSVQTVYFRGHGHGSTLEAAKQNAVNNAIREYIVDHISLSNDSEQAGFEEILVLNIEIEENSFVSTLKFFDEEIYLQDECFDVMESGDYEYFVLLSMSRKGVNRLVSEVIQCFTPFSRWERLYGSGEIINIDYAIYFSAIKIIENLPENCSIVIVAEGTSIMEEFAAEELITYISRSKKISVFDRNSFSEIETERKFQLSGEIDDDSIISIGHFTGADTVITVRITGVVNNWRIRFKIIDTKTAQLLYQIFYDFKL